MKELNKDNFDDAIASGVVLVDFWSESCERCKELMPDVHQLSEDYSGKVDFAASIFRATAVWRWRKR